MKIEEGYTLDFLVHSFFTGVPGLVLLYLGGVNNFDHGPLFNPTQLVLVFTGAILLIVLSILLLSIKSGIEFSLNENRMRVYKAILNARNGQWVDLNRVTTATLKLTHESQDMMSRGTEKTYVTKTYDLFLLYESGEEVEFHNFTERKLGIHTLAQLRDQFGIRVLDNTKKRLARPNRR